MKRNIISAFLAMVVFTIALGIVYPVVVTGISQVAFGKNADGNPDLIAKPWTKPVLDANGNPKKDADGNAVTEPDPRYFQPRPSQTGYAPDATFFSNRGPNQSSARYFYRDQLAAYIDLNGQYNPGLTNAKVPADAVTTSGSGVDPHISKENAAIQARRIAAVRGIPLERVNALIEDNTDGRWLGILGEPGVNVTTLNLALDAEAR